VPNFFSAFTSEVFRPLVTLLIPGMIGISTWFVALLWAFPSIRLLVGRNHTESSLVVLVAMIFAGMVFEDFGSRWEEWLDRRADKATDGEHAKTWFMYLRSAFVSDPIGRRYVRSVVLRLKFELGIAFSMISAIGGLVWLIWLGMAFKPSLLLFLVAIVFVTWGLSEATATHQVLAQTRAELLKEIRVVR
jgi:hypothetical protein